MGNGSQSSEEGDTIREEVWLGSACGTVSDCPLVARSLRPGSRQNLTQGLRDPGTQGPRDHGRAPQSTLHMVHHSHVPDPPRTEIGRESPLVLVHSVHPPVAV